MRLCALAQFVAFACGLTVATLAHKRRYLTASAALFLWLGLYFLFEWFMLPVRGS